MPVYFEVARWAWAILIAFAAIWIARKTRRDPDELSEPDWFGRSLRIRLTRLDAIALSLLGGSFILFWLGRNTVFPVPPDSYYHLLVARQIFEQGAIPIWNTWEFAPVGRPHLYPPLYHLILAGVARLLDGDWLATFRATQPFILPLAHLSTWYLARWMFDDKRALLALLLIGSEAMFGVFGLLGVPGVLATTLISLALICFLSGRWLCAGFIFTLAFYAHMGLPGLALLALGIFSLIQRRYLTRYLAMTLFVLIAIAPWYARTFVFRDWMSHPLETGTYGEFSPWVLPFKKLSWLQTVNVALLLFMPFAIWRARRYERRTQLLLCLLVAFLPMLISYGGRYYLHTIHLWAILIAGLFTAYIRRPVPIKRIVVCALLALCPTATLIGTGTPLVPGPYPIFSGWLLPPLVAAGGIKAFDGGTRLGYPRFEDAEALGNYLRETTKPDQIIHFGWDRDFALMVALAANRPIDIGAWEETQPPNSAREIMRSLANTQPNVVYIMRDVGPMPREFKVETFRGFTVARKSADTSQTSGTRKKRKR